ncbi:uncharacterized protein VTP21DRAFT_10457 [Calcarisporiella thermophila]|uniref:uncharacterized protein n=1 Tax=Calcarisporiella thermophila TaxID=911321 RepID=UPI00374305A4
MAERQRKILNEKHERILLELVRLPGNDQCADCGAKGPRWAAYNLGVFLCMRCAGIHRKMGTHISRVKSITFDQWTAEQIEMMKQCGNRKANSEVNPHPERHPIPIEEDESAMEKYIRNKWERKIFIEREEIQTPARSQSLMALKSSSNAPSKSVTAPPPLKHQSSEPILFRENESFFIALQKLSEMGFHDNDRNRRVLNTTSGDLKAAVEILSRLPGAGRPMPLRAHSTSDDEKLSQLWNMGFMDEQKNRDTLRRTGGNVEVAAALLAEERNKVRADAVKAEANALKRASTLYSRVNTNNNSIPNVNSGPILGKPQSAKERYQHKLPSLSSGSQDKAFSFDEIQASFFQPQKIQQNSNPFGSFTTTPPAISPNMNSFFEQSQPPQQPQQSAPAKTLLGFQDMQNNFLQNNTGLISPSFNSSTSAANSSNLTNPFNSTNSSGLLNSSQGTSPFTSSQAASLPYVSSQSNLNYPSNTLSNPVSINHTYLSSSYSGSLDGKRSFNNGNLSTSPNLNGEYLRKSDPFEGLTLTAKRGFSRSEGINMNADMSAQSQLSKDPFTGPANIPRQESMPTLSSRNAFGQNQAPSLSSMRTNDGISQMSDLNITDRRLMGISSPFSATTPPHGHPGFDLQKNSMFTSNHIQSSNPFGQMQPPNSLLGRDTQAFQSNSFF